MFKDKCDRYTVNGIIESINNLIFRSKLTLNVSLAIFFILNSTFFLTLGSFLCEFDNGLFGILIRNMSFVVGGLSIFFSLAFMISSLLVLLDS